MTGHVGVTLIAVAVLCQGEIGPGRMLRLPLKQMRARPQPGTHCAGTPLAGCAAEPTSLSATVATGTGAWPAPYQVQAGHAETLTHRAGSRAQCVTLPPG